MHKQNRIKVKILRYCFIGIFILYLALLLRITFFKQVRLDNLLSAIGASERTISIIPFQSVMEMIRNKVSMSRIIENILGNMILFVPLGLLLPILLKKPIKIILYIAIIFSLSIEIVQFILAMGSTDIDDLIFNVFGAIIGCLLFKKIKKTTKTELSFLVSTIVLLIVSGIIVFCFLLVNQTDLFITSEYKTVEENKELVSEFIETQFDSNGKFIAVKDSKLTIEKSVSNALEERTRMEFELTKDSSIYICYDEIDYFFNAIAGEYKRYEQVTYDDFISQMSKTLSRENNVMIWSSDKKHIDHLVIIEWVE